MRHNREEIVDYFSHFLENCPKGKVVETNHRQVDNVIIDSGIYAFSFCDGRKVEARYTFVYRKNEMGDWRIIEHHSSAMPGA